MTDQPKWKCTLKRRKHLQCYCAQFSDGSCVPPWVMPEYRERRDAEFAAGTDRSQFTFLDRTTYANLTEAAQ